MKNTILISAVVLAFSAVIAVPAQAHAFDTARLYDPLCLFACDDNPQQVSNTYTNSNNVNSNVNSPGGTVNVGPTSPVVTAPNPTPTYNYNYSYSSPTYTTPVYSTPTYVTPVYAYSNSYSYYPNYNSYPYYNSYPVYNYPSLYVSCSANTTYSTVGNSVVWTAYPSGGNGSYSYTWSGTDNIYGSGQSAYANYSYPGQKYAVVTVYSGNQQVSQNCSNSVSVSGYYATPVPYPTPYPTPYPITTYPTNTLDVACFADPATVRLNQPTTWSAEATGGIGPYSYSWTGTEGLNGNDRTVLKYYSIAGEKNAVVTVRSVDGRVGTKACSNNVVVRGNVVAPARPAVPQPPQVQPPVQGDNGLSASALFSLKNVPWGLVGILVILVLFFTVVYLLFNKTKI